MEVEEIFATYRKRYEYSPRPILAIFNDDGRGFGISYFLGNLFATALGGDVHIIANRVGAPAFIQYSLTIAGLVASCLFMFAMGKRFMSFGIPIDAAKSTMILYTIFLPWILGTGLVILVYLPMPLPSMANRIAESVFWSFALVGALRSRNEGNSNKKIYSRLNLIDIALVIIAIVIVRVMTRGIEFIPG